MLRRLATVLAAAVALAGCRGGGPSPAERAASARADQARAAAGQAGLPADVQDFMADAVASVGRRYEVAYDLGDRGATVLQRPPWRRLDVSGPGGDVQSYIANGQGVFSCHHPTGGSWSCQPDSQPPPAVGALSLDDVAGAITSLTESAKAYDLRIEHRRLSPGDSRCLIATPKAGGDPQTVCISSAGVPVLIDLGGGSPVMRATAYKDSAEANQFKLPAPARSG